METYITVQGNLTADPVGRTTASGAAVVNLRVASNPRRFDPTIGGFRDGDPIYIGVTCWRQLAGNVLASLRKGDSVVVFGKLLMRTYEAKEGGQRTVYEIDALSVGPDLSRWPADLRRPSRPAEEPGAAAGPDPDAATVPSPEQASAQAA
ncbi:MAG TPA: single-stranded DNA-binding protein [Mycobacteriales bacterium]|jgi:single-strand DNA-binding protein|nr:single-stranded DNA-binding protein [Mycobacteriales bacterium]